MRRENGMETGHAAPESEHSAPRRLSKQEIDRRISQICAEAVAVFQGIETERIEYLGEVIHAHPVDTRRFVRFMSRYISLN